MSFSFFDKTPKNFKVFIFFVQKFNVFPNMCIEIFLYVCKRCIANLFCVLIVFNHLV